MGEQRPLFAGNRGCGKRDKAAAVTTLGETVLAAAVRAMHADYTPGYARTVIVRIDGLELKPINRSAVISRGGRMAQAAATKKTRNRIKLEIIGAVGLDSPAPSRVVVTRLSFGTLDRGAVWEACKPVWDGIADAFKLTSDRELQERGDVAQGKCARGTKGVVIELFFST